MSTIVEFETIPELFNRVVDHFDGEGRPALRYKDRSTKEWVAISWEEYREQVRALAAHLYERGVRAGDRVAILSENRPEWMFTDLATQLLGAVNVSLYTSLPASHVAFIVRDSGSKVLVTSTSLQLREAPRVDVYGSGHAAPWCGRCVALHIATGLAGGVHRQRLGFEGARHIDLAPAPQGRADL